MIYPGHSTGYNNRQRRFVEQQQERQRQLDQQVKRTRKRVKLARIFTLLAVGFLLVLCGAPALISGQLLFGEPVSKPTQAAIVMNTPKPTPTLQSATWDTSQATSHNDEVGFVIVPDGFWQYPGMAEAYRQGTPVAELLLQYERYQAPQAVEQAQVAQPSQVQAVTPDPRIEQARNDLEVAQIQAQIDAAQAQAEAEQRIAAAKAEQAIASNQVLSERKTWALEIVGLIFLVGAGAVFMRLIGLPLIGWLFDGLVDWLGGRGVKIKYWLAEFMAPVEYEDDEPEAEQPVWVSHGSSNLRRVMREQAEQDREIDKYQSLIDKLTNDQINAIVDTWDKTKTETGKGNLTECQRQAFNGEHGGDKYYYVIAVLKKYRPGFEGTTPTPPAKITPYLGNTTQ